MADDATQTTTPAADGLAHVDSKGQVPTDGRKAFVWVQDADTGHRYDVPARSLPRRGLTPVEGYPLNYNDGGRPAKSRVDWQADEAETTSAGEQDLTPVAETGAPELTPQPVADVPAPEGGTGDDKPALAEAVKTTTKEGRTTR